MDNIAFTILGVSIQWYALLIVMAMVIGIVISRLESKKHGIERDTFYDLVFYLILFGIIGCRIWYVVFNWGYYSLHLNEIIQIWNGGLAIHGGIVAATIVIFVYSYRKKMNPLMISDIAVPAMLLGQAIGRWGNFFNQEAHGPATTEEFLSQTLHLPDFIVQGMNIDGVYYHPTFLYESVWNIIGLIIIVVLIRPKYRYKYGIITAFYLIWYGFIRTIIEQLRTDALMFGDIKVAAATSFLMILVGVGILIKHNRSKHEENSN